jgi:hypothetical protein
VQHNSTTDKEVVLGVRIQQRNRKLEIWTSGSEISDLRAKTQSGDWALEVQPYTQLQGPGVFARTNDNKRRNAWAGYNGCPRRRVEVRKPTSNTEKWSETRNGA